MHFCFYQLPQAKLPLFGVFFDASQNRDEGVEETPRHLASHPGVEPSKSVH
jgi:hypothetical protein